MDVNIINEGVIPELVQILGFTGPQVIVFRQGSLRNHPACLVAFHSVLD